MPLHYLRATERMHKHYLVLMRHFFVSRVLFCAIGSHSRLMEGQMAKKVTKQPPLLRIRLDPKLIAKLEKARGANSNTLTGEIVAPPGTVV